MFLSGSFLGGAFLSAPQQDQLSVIYDAIKINGECMIDNLRILNRSLTDEEKNNLSAGTEYVWTSNTILLCNFNGNTNAEDINIGDPITGFNVFRIKNDETLAELVVENLSPNAEEYRDYVPTRQNSYQYLVYAQTAIELSEPMQSNTVEHDYCGWFLTIPYNNYAYKFDLNLSSNAVNRNTDITIYDTKYTKYPTISFSEKNYLSGSINCLVGYMENGIYIDTIEYLDRLEADIIDGQIKELKNRKGEIWKVYTKDFTKKYDDKITDQIVSISFNFVEVEEV